jgi:hypothetical protein
MCGKVYRDGPADIRSQLEPHEKDEFVYEDGDPADMRPPSKKRTIIEAVAGVRSRKRSVLPTVAHYQEQREEAEREASNADRRATRLAAGLAAATARVPTAEAALADAETADADAATAALDAQVTLTAAETDCDSARAGVAVAAAALGVAAEKDKAAAEATLAAAQDDLTASYAALSAAEDAQKGAKTNAKTCARELRLAQDAMSRADDSLISMAAKSAEAEAAATTARASADAIVPSFLSVWDSWRTLLASDEQDEAPGLVDAEVTRVDAEVDAWAATLGEEAP